VPKKELEEIAVSMEQEFWCYAGGMYGTPVDPKSQRAFLRRIGVLLNFCPSCDSLDIAHSNGIFKCTQCKKSFRVTEVSE
jgi:ribosomal protein L37AE/L43A